MKLKIRYDDIWEVLELDDMDTEKLWLSLSLEDEELTEEEKESRIQEVFDEQYNRPEYNVFHRETRHLGFSRSRNDGVETNASEPNPKRVKDKSVFSREEDTRLDGIEYEEVCRNIRSILTRKPSWAEAVIAIRLDGWSVNDYADKLGLKDASIISHWLARAEKKLRDLYPATSDFLRVYGNKSETNKKRGNKDD